MNDPLTWNNLVNQIAFETIVGIIVTIIIAALVFLFNERVRKFFGKYWMILIDKQAGIIVSYTQKYDEPPNASFDASIFDELRDQLNNIDTITKVATNPKFIRIRSKKLGMTLDISLEEEPELSDSSEGEPEIASYNVVVKMDAEIHGVRQFSRIQDFMDIALKIHHIIHLRYFRDQRIRQSFAICDVVKISSKPRHENFNDEDLKARVSFVDYDLAITSKEPQNLSKTIKKYVYA